jgi:hypothetical protein
MPPGHRPSLHGRHCQVFKRRSHLKRWVGFDKTKRDWTGLNRPNVRTQPAARTTQTGRKSGLESALLIGLIREFLAHFQQN